MKNLKLLPIYAIYLVMFGHAAITKLTARQVPDWFTGQFDLSILNFFSGALAIQFYFIGCVELIISILFILSILRGEFLESNNKKILLMALFLAEFLFAGLSFGERIAGDFTAASQLFIYLTATVFFSIYIEKRQNGNSFKAKLNF